MRCEHAQLDGSLTRCGNSDCNLYGLTVSVGTCLGVRAGDEVIGGCRHYDGPERTPELIEATIGFKPITPAPGTANPADCIHRLKPLRTIPAPVCCGQVPTHQCDVHGECIIRNGARAKGWQPPDGVRVCEECKDRQPLPTAAAASSA